MRSDFSANAGALIAAVVFGASVVAVRVAVQDIPPLTLAVLRFGQGAFLLLLLLLVWAKDLLSISRRDVPYLLLLGAVFFTIFPVTFNTGIFVAGFAAVLAGVLLVNLPGRVQPPKHSKTG